MEVVGVVVKGQVVYRWCVSVCGVVVAVSARLKRTPLAARLSAAASWAGVTRCRSSSSPFAVLVLCAQQGLSPGPPGAKAAHNRACALLGGRDGPGPDSEPRQNEEFLVATEPFRPPVGGIPPEEVLPMVLLPWPGWCRCCL